MDALLLCYRGEPLREFPLTERPLEVGRGAFCDIVVHDARLAERELLVRRERGAVVAYPIRSGRAERPTPMAAGEPLQVGRDHSLIRVPDTARDDGGSVPDGCTEPVELPLPAPVPLSLVVGRGSEARRVALGVRPLTIGAADDNDVVVGDRTVSARHCRIEPHDGGIIVRDLGSRNGTWVDGVRVLSATAHAGSMLRVGRTELALVPRGRSGDARDRGMVAVSPSMLHVLAEVERYARLAWPALVVGESGAGKEGVAQALHRRGPRARGPFVALNAGGLPRELVETELFGHERGAFTGAVAAHAGAFEQAHGGTLFLDEIGELPMELQARLLRVLETWEVRRVGAERASRVDVRLVCATHRDLRAMVVDGTFRQDLYYRVARLVVEVPPLRARPEDVKALAEHFLDMVAADVGPRTLSESAVARLLSHDWPGNARELRNVLCAAAAHSASSRIEAPDVERALERVSARRSDWLASAAALEEVVSRHGGNLSAAARALGMARSTLRDRIRGPKRCEPHAGAPSGRSEDVG